MDSAHRLLLLLCLGVVTETAACRPEPGSKAQREKRAVDALPYLSETPLRPADRKKEGVQVHVRGQATSGLTVFCSEKNAFFDLLGLDGQRVKRVALPGYCKLARPISDGFVVLHGRSPSRTGMNGLLEEQLSRIRWDGSLVWTSDETAHHEVQIQGGEVLSLGYVAEQERFDGQSVTLAGERLIWIDLRNGRLLRSFALRAALRPLVGKGKLARLAAVVRGDAPRDAALASDVYHCNRARRQSASRFLISCAGLGLVGVLDVAQGRLIWKTGLKLDGPHHPTETANGRVLFFDNGYVRGWSRIVEQDTETGAIAWSYEDRGPPAFFSKTRGSVQPLPNGNLLVAESEGGRIFELTRDKVILWEFFAPITNGKRQTVYRAERLFRDAIKLPDYRTLWDRHGGVN